MRRKTNKASNQTENYGLNQWKAEDKVLRTEFNEDNAKLDTAIKAADLAGAAKTLADSAYTPENYPVVFGSYTGDDTVARKIELGFTPKAVLVAQYNGYMDYRGTSSGVYYGGLAMTGLNASASKTTGITEWSDTYTIVAVTEGGFLVNYGSSVGSNLDNSLFYYIAFR